MNKTFLIVCVSLFALCVFATTVSAHCEIPCGIYDDAMRIKMIKEHITTIEKSMKKAVELGNMKGANSNQLIRWVMNKEHHANELQEIVTQYFMTQRIKPGMKEYAKKLGLLHEMLVYSMKCKQTTDLTHIAKLRELINQFDMLYFEKEH